MNVFVGIEKIGIEVNGLAVKRGERSRALQLRVSALKGKDLNRRSVYKTFDFLSFYLRSVLGDELRCLFDEC